jgi:uncharacterized protein YifE (UPF0438 family)
MGVPELHKHYLRLTFRPAVDLSFLAPEAQEAIVKYGTWFDALMRGVLEPYTEAQEKFIEVCKGKRPAETLFERSWVRYRVECMFQTALNLEKNAGAVSYREIRTQFERLARFGHEGAVAWLEREGGWTELPSRQQRGYAASTVWNNPFPLVWQVSGSFGSKYDYGQGPVDE